MSNIPKIAADLVTFFDWQKTRVQKGGDEIKPRSLGNFLKEHPEHHGSVLDIQGICSKLVNKHALSPANTIPGRFMSGDCYYALQFDEKMADYGKYDFLVFGSPYIRKHFLKSVLPIFITEKDASLNIGTAFLLAEKKIVTARHCVENKKKIEIPEIRGKISGIYTLPDEKVDLAIIEYSENLLPKVPGFLLREHNILENVLTMGYPPIPGFESILVANNTEVGSHLKSSTGRAVGENTSYLDNQNYLLLNSRVKGGNSGGPVIGEDGLVVGVVTDCPEDDKGIHELGYAIATPISYLVELINAFETEKNSLQKLQYDY